MDINKDEERLQTLEKYHVLEADIHEDLQGLTELASKICDAPISLINILDNQYQIIKASKGLEVDKIPRDSSFCHYTISDDEMMIIEDAQQDDRFKNTPFVEADPNIRFYAGMPLQTKEGHNLGTICVIDHEPRQLTNSQKESLKLLAEEVVARFELVQKTNKLKKRNQELEKSDIFLQNSSDTQAILDPHTLHFLEINDEAPKLLGGSKDDYLGEPFGNRIADLDLRQQMLDFLNQREETKAEFTAPVQTSSGEILYLDHTFSWHDGRWFMTARDITEREKAQQELRSHSDAIEASMDGIAILDQEYNFVFSNKAHANIFGYQKDELTNERWEMLYDAEERQRFKNTTYAILEDTGQWRGEAEGLTKDGRTVPLEISLSKRQNGSVVCIARDITKRRQTQHKLRETLTNLTIGQELAQVGSWTWNMENNNLRWSEKVYDICGIDNISQEPSLDLFWQLVHPDDREQFQETLSRVREGEENIGNYEHRLLMEDGSIKWVQHSGRTTFDSASKPIEVNGAIQDITKQKRAQLKLKREKELSDKIINSLPILFFMFDTDGNAIRWNDKMRQISGYSEQQIAYMNPTDFFPEDQRAQIKRAINKVYKQGEATIEADLQHQHGNQIPHILSARLFKSGSEKYFLGTGLDISEMKEYEHQLEKSLEEKEVLLSEIHHRVKNNLAIISGLLQLESFKASDEQTQNILQNSQMRIHSMAQVHELLYNAEDFNNLSFESFVTKIIGSIKDVYQQPMGDITFNLKVDDIKLNVNQAIPCSLIINETVTNAYKHAFEASDDGRINVELKETDGKVQLSINDNGIGLPDDFSLSESESLGFTLINTLKNQLDAHIDIQSEDGTHIALTFEKQAIKGSGSSLTL